MKWRWWLYQASLVFLFVMAGWNIGRLITAWRTHIPWRIGFVWLGVVGMIIGAASAIVLIIVLSLQDRGRSKRKRHAHR